MDNYYIHNFLESQATKNYKAFSTKLLPGGFSILGVSIGSLDKFAKTLVQQDPYIFLNNKDFTYIEYITLYGMVIAYLPISFYEKQKYIQSFLPFINNWSSCDSFCSRLKPKKGEKALVWDFITPYFYSAHPYSIRFAIVMTLSYFAEEQYLSRSFVLFDQIKLEHYYVQMAIAWAISIFYKSFKGFCLAYLQNNTLDTFTHNKAIEKIMQSLNFDPKDRDLLKSLKK